MRGEELGLCLATAAAFSIPPKRTVGVENISRSALDCNSRTTDVEERTHPLFIAPGRCTLEDDGRVISKAGKVQRSTRGHSDVGEDNGSA